MRILLVDDDPDYADVISMGLLAAGLECTVANDGQTGLETLRSAPGGHFDLIVLDVQMPGVSGWDLIYELRQAGQEIPVIFATALETKEHKVKGLGLGADDYVVKPVEIEELKARIEAVVRRRESLAPLDWGDVRLDLARRNVQRAGHAIDLSPREFDLLLVLVRAKGEIVSRETLLKDVWELDFDPGTNVLDVHIGRLRKKIDRHGPPVIQNERGVGYRIEARV